MSDKNRCPICNLGMLTFPSLRYKICVNCHKKFAWKLDKGQFRLIQHQR